MLLGWVPNYVLLLLAFRLLDTATTATEADFKAGKVSAQNVMLTHQYADPQPVDVTIELAGEHSLSVVLG